MTVLYLLSRLLSWLGQEVRRLQSISGGHLTEHVTARCVLLMKTPTTCGPDLMSYMYRLLTYRALKNKSLNPVFHSVRGTRCSAWHWKRWGMCVPCMFVASQVDLLLVHPHFLLIVPLYVLLGRCSVILSRAGCLYDPRTEIWLARPECLSFFPFPPSLPLLRSSLSLFSPPSPPPLLFCMPASPSLHHT